MTDAEIKGIVRSIRPALQRANLTEEQRAQLVYDLVHEVYDHVKFDVYGPMVDAPERNRIGEVLNVALPPVTD
ncbi:hypothetical protein [Microbacterium oxydans]|jgi:hypothetical protein|uniref:hypothetical protein n=1 Tax=Microbacterium oxydans TaxID=82380 RepID=UPI0024AE2DFF|nr:hypothetical protein [Microbacterium oxydans]